MSKTKVCITCNKRKTKESFSHQRNSCKKCRTQLVIDRYWRNPELHKRRRLEQYRALKREFIAAYGGKCRCCGESHEVFLTVEHLNRDGKKHREELGTDCVYSDLKKRGWPQEDFALMCFNCNRARWTLGECPHVD